MKTPNTLVEAVRYFADYDNCKSFMVDLRWPDGKVTCPQCGSDHVTYLETAKLWKCYAKHPKAKFSLKTGTIFEDSPLPIDKWLIALWLIVNCKNGISSMEIARHLGITQKSAWFMAHRLRLALHAGSFDKMTGEVEADETFIGGKARNMSIAKRKRLAISMNTPMLGKVAVMGLLARHGKDGHSEVRLQVIPSNRKRHVKPVIEEHVEPGSTMNTDALMSYWYLSSAGSDYIHKVIDHAEKYAEGTVHTNGMENFWSLLKRAIKGTYVSVEPFHLFRYLDEQAYRFNNRQTKNEFGRFALAASQIVGKRLTWNQVVGAKEDGSETTH